MLIPSVQLRRNMVVSTSDATAYGVMVGIGETFLPAFALAVGLGEVTAGLVGSVPLMAGGVLQLISLWALSKGFSQKWWVVLAASLQALAFVPLIWVAYLGSVSGPALLAIASFYWAAGLASGPAWNGWIERVIPKQMRANYFAKRTRATQLATMLGFVAGGLLLQFGGRGGWLLLAFAGLFAIAFVARVISAIMLALHRLPPAATHPAAAARPIAEPQPTASQSVSRAYAGKHLLIYLVLVQGAAQIAGPFFTPYMLHQLQLSYLSFTMLVGAAFLAKVVALPAWGQLARRRGAGWLLTVGGTSIVPLSAIWIVSQNFYWLLFIQVLSGVAWAAYELGFFLMFFEALPAQRRVKMLTYYNMANTSAWCIGATLGASLLFYGEATVGAYYGLFALSSAGRLLAVCYLYATRPEVKVRVTQIGLRVVGLRPSSGQLDSPILPSLPEVQSPSKAAG